MLVTHGATDKLALVAGAKHTAATIAGAKLSVYDGVGHAPFWEDTARFNAELSAFVRAPTTQIDVLAARKSRPLLIREWS